MSYAAFVAIVAVTNLLCVIAAVVIARRKGHDPFNWVLICAVMGPFGLIALFAQTRRPRPAAVATGRADTLIPTDGSQFSLAAVRHFIGMRPPGSTVTLLAVLPVERREAPAAELQQDIDSYVAEAQRLLGEAGIAAETVIAYGDPGTEIVRFARDGGFEQIIMGRRGRGAVAKLVLGSVSEKVTRESPVPVTLAG
jgi:nucleotide-binding universal stress UspA family protein